MIETLSTIHDVLVTNINKFRKAKGHTIPELAEASGIQFETLKGILYNENWPELANLEAIANALDLPTEALFENPELAVIKVTPGPKEALEIVRKALLAKNSVPAALAARLAGLEKVCADENKLRSLDRLLSEFAEDSVSERKDSGGSRG